MRVALTCPYAWDATGGVQNHVAQLAEVLQDRGHEVVVLAPATALHASVPPHVRLVGRAVGLPFNGSIARIAPDPRTRGAVARELRRFRPDVVHAHEPFTPSTSFYATMVSPAPVVAVSHTFFERSLLFDLYKRPFHRLWMRPKVWLAVSDATASFLRRHLGHGADIRVVPNGVDVDMFAGAAAAELPPGRKVLFVNRLDERKGFPVAVDAFATLGRRFPDLLLVVAGDGRQRAAVDTLPQELRRRVVMLGRVPHADVPALAKAADVFVGPATGRESFGIVLVEAMAAGLPVVASDIPGYREVVRSDVDGILVPPSDPQALADGITRVVEDGALAERMRQAGQRRAERFRWDVVADEIEDVYREVAGSG